MLCPDMLDLKSFIPQKAHHHKDEVLTRDFSKILI